MVQNFDEEAVVVSYSGNGYYFKPFGYIWTNYSKGKKFVSIKFKTIDHNNFVRLMKTLAPHYSFDTWSNRHYNSKEYVIRVRIKIPWETRF